MCVELDGEGGGMFWTDEAVSSLLSVSARFCDRDPELVSSLNLFCLISLFAGSLVTLKL